MNRTETSVAPSAATPSTAIPDLFELISEVLLSSLPYRRKPRKTEGEGFYLVCDYWPIPRGTVLLYYPNGAQAAHVQGYLPQGTPAEKSAFREMLQRHTQDSKLDFKGMLKNNLRVCSERDGVHRLLEIHRLLGVARASTNRPQFH